jgi:hypothetical protein
MRFLNRGNELARLRGASRRRSGGLVVVYGRRRIGKTRLLLEWVSETGGLYAVADQSAADVQRRYFATAASVLIPGFGDVEYPNRQTLLERLAREAARARWRGPLVFDEFPYLVAAAPELPSVMQRWLDHDAKGASLTVAIAGSSQRMMQGLVLSANAPLFGRANEILALAPLDVSYVSEAFGGITALEAVAAYSAWGGVPRYWELARDVEGDVMAQIDRLALDPLGPLHREPDRLLLEELPPAVETRPLLDAIGSGAHRVSEIAARLGRPATSMARPLERLISMGLIRRDVPFGESERAGRRSLYAIDDPFFRLWFRVVAPHRGQLVASTRAGRLQILRRHWDALVAQTWEDLCRRWVPRAGRASPVTLHEPWGPASRWWHGSAPEWDVVSQALDASALLLGEAKWSRKPWGVRETERALAEIRLRPAPRIAQFDDGAVVVRALFVADLDSAARAAVRRQNDVAVITANEILQGSPASSVH